jgi:hypothetical protein
MKSVIFKYELEGNHPVLKRIDETFDYSIECYSRKGELESFGYEVNVNLYQYDLIYKNGKKI